METITTPEMTQVPEHVGLRALLRGDIQREVSGLIDELDARLLTIDQREQELYSSTREVLSSLVVSILSQSDVHKPDESTTDAVDLITGAMSPTHAHMPLLSASAGARVPAWLYGEAGSGKSTAAETVADTQELECRSISLCPTTTKSDILGYRDATGQYRHTAFRQTYEDGGVFLFDEIDNAHPSTLALINHALGNRIAEFPDGRVEMHPDTIIVAAANTIGKGANAQYVGRAVIDAATLDRFVFIPWDIDEGLEEQIALGETISKPSSIDVGEGGVPSERVWLSEVRDFRTRLALTGIRHICSTRAVIFGNQLARQGVGRRWLTEMCLHKGMSENDRARLDAIDIGSFDPEVELV